MHRRHIDVDRTTIRHRLGCVEHDIFEGLVELTTIDSCQRKIGLRVQTKDRLGSVQDEGCRLTQQVNDRFSVCDWSAPAGERQQATGHFTGPIRCLLRRTQGTVLRRSNLRVQLGQGEIADNGLEQIVEVVCQSPRQNAEGFHLLRFQSRYIEQMVFGCDPRQIGRSAHQFLLEACWNPRLTWEIAKVPNTLSDCEKKGVDQQAHTLERSATSRKSAHSGSVDTSITNTGCPTNAAVPQDAAHSPISKPSRIFMYSGETLGPAADRRLLP